jgi:pimeloyl-ACP methyl ester carboxylesterase
MLSIEIPREEWPEGPWLTEPSRRFWLTRAGLHAFILRHPEWGHLCGYVEYPLALQQAFADAEAQREYRLIYPDLPCHGGVSWYATTDEFSDYARPEYDAQWVGFDCNHAMDYAPGLEKLFGSLLREYRTFDFVISQCESLALAIREQEGELE